MNEELQLFNDYRQAISNLLEHGTLTTLFVTTPEGNFIRVSINIDGIEYTIENEDLFLAVIQLSNEI